MYNPTEAHNDSLDTLGSATTTLATEAMSSRHHELYTTLFNKVLKMRPTLFAIVISAFVTGTFAQSEYYIRNEPSGLNVTWDDEGYIYMEPGIRKHTITAWDMYPVASDIKNWVAFGASYFYLQFDLGRDGDTARCLDEARIFEIRKAESHSYVIDVQSIDAG